MSLLEKALKVPVNRVRKCKMNGPEVDELFRAYLEGKLMTKQVVIALDGNAKSSSNTFYSAFTSSVRRMFANGEMAFTKKK